MSEASTHDTTTGVTTLTAHGRGARYTGATELRLTGVAERHPPPPGRITAWWGEFTCDGGKGEFVSGSLKQSSW